MNRRRLAPLLLLAALAAMPRPAAAVPAVSAGPSVALDPYPVSAPSPLGNSIPPDFLDEDETVRVRINPDGAVRGLVDDALIKIRGSGDYVVHLPAKVASITNLGGDSVPGLQDGHVSFLGHAIGAQQLAVEAALDPAQVGTLPLTVRPTYLAGGREVAAAEIPRARGPVTVTLTLTNRTAQPHAFVRGTAPLAPLAQVLEALRRVPDIYIPEINLGEQLPVPAALQVAPGAAVESHDTMVPLTLTSTVRLPAGATVTGVSPPADVTTDARGTRLAWLRHLPSGPEAPAADTLTFTFSSPRPSLPAIDVRADPLPLTAATFTPPGGGAWEAYLAGRPNRDAETMLAQQGMASLHRIGELAQPLGRPGKGPVKVKYDFILESTAAPAVRVAGPPPVRGRPLVIALTLALGGAVVLLAARAWVRH